MEHFIVISLLSLTLLSLTKPLHAQESIIPSFSYKKTTGQKFTKTPLETHENVTVSQCAMLGSQLDDHNIFNFIHNGVGTRGNCEIILSYHYETWSNFITDAIGTDVYTLQKINPDPCLPTPCHHNLPCYPIISSGRSNFYCECVFPLGTRDCSVLSWAWSSSKGDLVIFLDASVQMQTHQESADYCVKIGKKMVIDANQEMHDFIIQAINENFPDANISVFFWLGLSRPTKDDNYVWVNGSVWDGSFAPWQPDTPLDGLYVGMVNDDTHHWSWLSLPNDGQTNYQTHAISVCEFNYPILLV